MKNKCLLIAIILSFGLIINSFSQEEDKKYGISFSGFVKNDFILDSRQTVSVREGHFLLYPTDEFIGAGGQDINARANFNYLSIQSRLTGKLTGPDAFGAKTSGVLEGAFFGATNSDINGFRLRHAFFKLNWTNTELLLGQYWHMMFNTRSFAGTVSFNTGVPFQYFTRNPQIRITQRIGNLSIAGMVATQRDFSSPGGSSALRNALLPDLQGQIAYSTDNFLFGLTGGYKKIVPRIKTDSLYKTSKGVGGFTGQAFMKIVSSPLTFKLQAAYLQNGFDGLTLGGFVVQSITDPMRDYREYATINVANFWTDIHTNGDKVQVGVFAGYSQNLGTIEAIEDVSKLPVYTRGHTIAYLYRVSPRFIINSGKTRFAFELEHTGASYGDSVNENAIPQDLSLQINNRFLVAAYYFF
jgi:hypothetical protein